MIIVPHLGTTNPLVQPRHPLIPEKHPLVLVYPLPPRAGTMMLQHSASVAVGTTPDGKFIVVKCRLGIFSGIEGGVDKIPGLIEAINATYAAQPDV